MKSEEQREIIPRQSDFLMYTTPEGGVRVDVLFSNENVWLPQKLMALLFDCSVDNISLHLKNIFIERELDEQSVTEEYSTTATDGKKYKTKHYSLEVIIAVGYRVHSERGMQFRTWATDKLKRYVIKGFVIDGDRFKRGTKFDAQYFDELLEEVREIRASERMAYQKITDIYSTSSDYSGNTSEAQQFFATVQNKLHWAITGHTAAELIAERADSHKPAMGLTSWRKGPHGKILPTDVRIGKNYMAREEIQQLNHIVDMYLDYAELQASRGRLIRMKEWEKKLNAFLKFNEMDVLRHAGKISHEVAIALADKEYAKYRVEQDRTLISDFDREMKRYLTKSKPNKRGGNDDK